MVSRYFFISLVSFFWLSFLGCDRSSEDTPNVQVRDFKMGFTTWSYGPNLQDVDNTYAFITDNADIYAEHIDSHIPWNSWMNDLPLPEEFTNEISQRVNRKLDQKPLLLSVSPLNLNRDDLAPDFNGSTPAYSSMDDVPIENAYYKHIDYLVNLFAPDYLVIAIEVNELRLKAEDKWSSYKSMISNVKSRIKQEHPNLHISESITLHHLFEPNVTNPEEYIQEMTDYMAQMDFVAISFYPFFKNLHSKDEFQQAFDFLHSHTNQPIAFVETAHIAENLEIPAFNLSIQGSENEQNDYLETLIANAEKREYLFLIWWAHRDYDALWETFPEDLKDIGTLWRDTGLIDENGGARVSKDTWSTYLEQ